MSTQSVLREYENIHKEYNEKRIIQQKISSQYVKIRAFNFLMFLGCLGWALALSRAETINTPYLLTAFFASLSFLGVFILFAIKHSRTKYEIKKLSKLLLYNEHGQMRVKGTWSDLEIDGSSFSNAQHCYCDDLDIFGKGSIFQLINTSYTYNGQKKLAEWLLNKASLEEIQARQEAVKELKPLIKLRHDIAKEELLLQTNEKKIHSFLEWVQKAKIEVKGPFILLWVLPFLTLFGFSLSLISNWTLNNVIWILPLFISWLTLRFFKAKVAEVYEKMDQLGEGVLAYHHMFEVLEKVSPSFQSKELKRLNEAMLVEQQQPAQKLKELAAIAMSFDNRHGMLYSVMNIILMWDIRLLLKLKSWCEKSGDRIETWLDSLFQIQALNSLASFAHIHPQYPFPSFVSSPIFEATSLGHPCILEQKRKTNDFVSNTINQIAIVTGSNMSGKSTMLRSIGINIVLANSGSCVCAQQLKIGEFTLRTCMRARDDLQKGFSYFYAELHKLKQVIDGIQQEQQMFFLVDEMLSGTNSRERTIASVGIIKHLFQHKAYGLVATHDLFLASLAEEFAEIHNYHFTDKVVDDQMHFDYQLRKGPVETSNALFLMKKVGIDIKLEEKNI